MDDLLQWAVFAFLIVVLLIPLVKLPAALHEARLAKKENELARAELSLARQDLAAARAKYKGAALIACSVPLEVRDLDNLFWAVGLGDGLHVTAAKGAARMFVCVAAEPFDVVRRTP